MDALSRKPNDDAVSPAYQETAVLCSAGLDSAVLLAHEAQRATVMPVYVSVGLAWEPDERLALDRLLRAPAFASRVRPPVALELTMRDVYPSSHWAIQGVPPAYDTPDEHVYLAGRNVVLLTKAGVFCEQRHIGRIAIGPLAGNPFPDATPAFFTTMGQALSLGLAHAIEIVAPFRDLHKSDVIRLGRQLGVPLELTLSCMRPSHGAHCGACSKCRERHDAFVEAGVGDPTTYLAGSARSVSNLEP
jgi:7-cyano-7-deazaguanine synthase